MYFNNNNNNTNIDSEFKRENNLLPNIINFINKFKIIIIIILIVTISIIITISLLKNKKQITYLDLSGMDTVTIYQGGNYIEPGYKAYDKKKNDLTEKVKITSNLDINKIGEYEIKYTVNDITKTRKIKVIQKDEEYTFIYLNTINNKTDIYLNINEKYVEPGYKVFNSTGADLTNQVKIDGTVDITKKGIYKLTYYLIDSNNITISATRTVIVMDSEINLSLDNNNYTNKDVKINIDVIDDYFEYILLPNGEKIYEKKYSYTVNKNGKYIFTVYNKQKKKKEASIEVKNIDRTIPNGSCSGYYKNNKTTINISAQDNIKISKYVINNNTYTENQIVLNKKIETANIKIYDTAGNTKNINCKIENKIVEEEPPKEETTNKPEEKEKLLEMHFIASGHYDDAILIRTNEKTIFIDGGRWNCRKYVTPYLKKIGVTKIDAMLGSHLHFNHIQMQADILDNFEVKKVYYPDNIFNCKKNNSCTEEDGKYIISKLKDKNITPIIATAGTKVTIGDIELYFIGPDKIETGSSVQNTNSSIMILKYYNNTFMFTGDAGSATLNSTKLKKHADNLGISLDINLLKYPHHGNASLTDTFLKATKPEYTVVPNYYFSSHPTTANKNRLINHNVKMYRQSDSSTGNIVVTSDGNNIKITNNAKPENYKR